MMASTSLTDDKLPQRGHGQGHATTFKFCDHVYFLNS